MKTPIRALGLLAIALAPAPAAIWPDQIPPFFRKSAEPQTAKGDPALWEEYGFDEAEQAIYEAGGKRYSTTAWRFQDPTGAMAAYQDLRPEGSAPSDMVVMGVSFPGGFLMAYGNYGKTTDELMSRPTHKRCRVCDERRPLTDFEYRKDGFGGRRTVCVKCRCRPKQKKEITKPQTHKEWLKGELGWTS